MIRDYLALVGCVSLLGFALWFATRLCRNGGSSERGTPHWNAATSRAEDFGRCTLDPAPTFTPEQRARLDEAMAKVRAKYAAQIEAAPKRVVRVSLEEYWADPIKWERLVDAGTSLAVIAEDGAVYSRSSGGE